MNQYNELQSHTFKEALKLANAGEEFSHLIQILSPEFAFRLKLIISNLNPTILSKTIYGRAILRSLNKPTKSNKK
jgi:hypothetical protein